MDLSKYYISDVEEGMDEFSDDNSSIINSKRKRLSELQSQPHLSNTKKKQRDALQTSIQKDEKRTYKNYLENKDETS